MLWRYAYFQEIQRKQNQSRSPAKAKNGQLIIPISAFFNCLNNFTLLAHASKSLILDSMSNNFFEAKTREVMQRYAGVRVTSIVLQLARSRIKHFQYLRLTNIDFEQQHLKHKHARLHALLTEKQAICGLVILNSIPGKISLSNSIFSPNQDIQSMGGEIVCCV